MGQLPPGLAKYEAEKKGGTVKAKGKGAPVGLPAVSSARTAPPAEPMDPHAMRENALAAQMVGRHKQTMGY